MSASVNPGITDLDDDVDDDDDEGVGNVEEKPRLNGFDADRSVQKILEMFHLMSDLRVAGRLLATDR